MAPLITITRNLELYPDQKERIEKLGQVTYNDSDPKGEYDWYERCKNAEIICSGFFGVNTEQVYRLHDVFISLPFVGTEFLDLKKLKENNITVANAPGCNKDAVAEWAVGVLLWHSRKLDKLMRVTDMPQEQILEMSPGLFGKKVTILGTGNVGTRIAEILNILGMKVTIFKRGDNLIESVAAADVVVNCLGANPSTEGLLDHNFFFSMKKGSFFLSVARQQTYDEQALKQVLDAGILSGAADDAATANPGDATDPRYTSLLKHKKILATPHIAWCADSERRHSNDIMIDNIEAWLKGRPINLVN